MCSFISHLSRHKHGRFIITVWADSYVKKLLQQYVLPYYVYNMITSCHGHHGWHWGSHVPMMVCASSIIIINKLYVQLYTPRIISLKSLKRMYGVYSTWWYSTCCIVRQHEAISAAAALLRVPTDLIVLV